jgi:hypothetical protein
MFLGFSPHIWAKAQNNYLFSSKISGLKPGAIQGVKTPVLSM